MRKYGGLFCALRYHHAKLCVSARFFRQRIANLQHDKYCR